MDQIDAVKSLEQIVGNDDAIEILMQIDKVLDSYDVYAFKNWIEGEIVDGPHIERHWVTMTIMYKYEDMPDPEAVKRIKEFGGNVYFAEDTFISAAKLVTPDDTEITMGKGDGSMAPMGPRAKKVETKVWLVTLEMPRYAMKRLADAEQELDKKQVEDMETPDVSDDMLDASSSVQVQDDE